MSPLEPRPILMGTIGLPSSLELPVLCFCPQPAEAPSSLGANRPPVAAATAVRKERRFRLSLRLMRAFFPLILMIHFSAAGVTTAAQPTISINESPGIQSTATHAREGVFPSE